ncbi:hypothetical protein O1R50_19825 [Glycomyces luteolus]|uniref:Uncharacterized protein n=1 Tax=Glycomyces luteolus TaxID=2670330 RepID=A0A9X3SRP8_9ACTN|nr:hypothetical protein [Glycomyces luteolus]MDA1361887.1 hypothetical protein [Glycomyces luteolus]
MEIIDIEPGDARLTAELLPVLRELRPDLSADDYVAVYDEGHGQGLRFTAAYAEGRCVGVAGWRTVANTNRFGCFTSTTWSRLPRRAQLESATLFWSTWSSEHVNSLALQFISTQERTGATPTAFTCGSG